MEAQEKTILIYVKQDGKIPFSDWLESLRDRKSRAIIRTRINRIRLGNLGDCKTVGGGVSELRINFAAGYRVYFAQQGNTTIILLCGGDKSSHDERVPLRLSPTRGRSSAERHRKSKTILARLQGAR